MLLCEKKLMDSAMQNIVGAAIRAFGFARGFNRQVNAWVGVP
jgi:hypothetical protein